ncbi:MAG: DsbE family thiol:disulfide interchange protein [Methylohalobius sp.]|nr:DsbE family thiol:disulfide interchange protein [Methylohalobius sp.]
MLKYLLPLGLFAALLILLGIGLTLNPREVPSPLIGQPAPNFTLQRLDDPSQTVSEEIFRGKVSLLNVWASWCLACRQEHPQLMELRKRGEVLLVGLNYKDDRGSALELLERAGNPYQVIAFDGDGKAGIDYGVYGVPETFVIDKQGVIRYKHIGPITPEDWEQKLAPLVRYLEKQP